MESRRSLHEEEKVNGKAAGWPDGWDGKAVVADLSSRRRPGARFATWRRTIGRRRPGRWGRRPAAPDPLRIGGAGTGPGPGRTRSGWDGMGAVLTCAR
jgi:hypothetical protein